MLISRLRSTAHLKWSPVYNLHITTKFIGEWPPPRLPELVARLSEVPAPAPIEIDIRGLGWFPNPHHPRVFWAGVQGNASLAQLAAATEKACGELGIPVENRPFSPHLTLARIKHPTPLQALRATVSDMESAEFGSFKAGSYNLYLSKSGPCGSIYTPLHQFSLPTS